MVGTTNRVHRGSFDVPNFTLPQPRHLLPQNPGLEQREEVACAGSPHNAPFTAKALDAVISLEGHRGQPRWELTVALSWHPLAQSHYPTCFSKHSRQSSVLTRQGGTLLRNSNARLLLQLLQLLLQLAPCRLLPAGALLTHRKGPAGVNGSVTRQCCVPKGVPCAFEALKNMSVLYKMQH